jgi:hypothetical protein
MWFYCGLIIVVAIVGKLVRVDVGGPVHRPGMAGIRGDRRPYEYPRD